MPASEAGFLYNLSAILLALSGQYLLLNRLTSIWIVVVSITLALAWMPARIRFTDYEAPLLCLPFNLAVLGSIADFNGSQRWGAHDQVVPLELAIDSPATVALWAKKFEIARRCWQRLA